ncbi:hypothetical protein, partial [Actinomyces oris]|uniref:hypothetical protein n=1 Tax=Actinomyces oris TaxID=544580 RepID=UPI001C4B5C3B
SVASGPVAGVVMLVMVWMLRVIRISSSSFNVVGPMGPGVAARAEAGTYLPSRRARVKTPGAAAGCAAADSGHEGVGTDETVAS